LKLRESHKDRSSKSGDINNLVSLFKKLGQLEKVEALLKQAIKLGASHARKHYNMAVIYEEIGNNKLAIHFYCEFLKARI
jgi:Tfp pilus assembly protein PilF